MENDETLNPESQKIPTFVIKVSHEAKLRELLRNLTSIDLQLCSEASKEFMQLLRGDEGGEMLRQYVQTSPGCSELLQAWNLRQSNPGLSYIMSLINVILSHKDGVYKPNDVARVPVSRALDKFARLILEEKIGDVYKELNNKEGKGKHAALLLMASIVRRGSGLASDVAKTFNFKLPNFLKLAEYDKRRKNIEKIKRKSSTRRSYVKFAMSFLEIGDPRLLRWVLQQKEMFSGVLRGLGSDEEETAVYVLSTLRDKVLVPESLVPVGLRSVLFGSVTLEQLVNISGRDDGGDATEVAQKVLFMVCTDPSNGLMPDSKALPFPLKGNPTRLLGVMKKLKATEIDFHRDLLLGIVRGRPSLCSLYLDEFPYNLEDHATWFAAVSLAANLIASVNAGLCFDFLDSKPPSFNSSEVQSIIKCIGSRTFNRMVMNKGLLHSESQIQHGTLRLVLEALMLLDSLFSAINHKSESSKCKLVSLKQDIQNEVQLLLPDHQVLLSLISSINSRYKSEERNLKRGPDTSVLLEHKSKSKKLKTSSTNEETDILIGGITSSMDTATPDDDGIIKEDDNVKETENQKSDASLITELWESHESNNLNMLVEDEESYFYSKLLDALKFYHRTMPSVLEGSFDFFKVLPANALSLPSILLQSLLSLLVEHIGCSSKKDIPMKCPPLMYKHLMHFINLVVNASVKDIKDQAYVLAQAAMLSTGAFDSNKREVNAWLLFLPGFNTMETVQNFSSVVNSFFCDVVSTVGNNLFKYWDLLRSRIHQLETTKDVYPQFSPLFVCVLEKCLRLLGSESGTFTLSEKSMISIYVSNTLRYLLQTQVEAGLLSSLIYLSLSERLKDVDGDSCEWRPLKSLVNFSKSIVDQESCMLSLIDRKSGLDDDSFVNLRGEVTNLADSETFYVLFPAIITTECLYLSKSSKLQEFLLAKLSKEMSDNFVCSFRLVFFWFHHVQSSYRNKPTEEYVQISEICFALIKSMLEHLSTGNHNHYVQEIAETIFCHPAVISSLESPLSVDKELKDDIFQHPTDDFLCLAKEGVHTMDYHVSQALGMFCNHFFSSSNKVVARVFKCFLQKLVFMLKARFHQFIESQDPLSLIPTLFAFHTLIRFISPQELLELADWIFSKINKSSVLEPFKTSALCVGLNIAGCAFELLLCDVKKVDVVLFEKVYFHVVEIASHSELTVADLCLLKAVKIANIRTGPTPTPQSLPQCMVMSRIIAATPMDFLTKCLQKTSMIKGQLLFQLTESSLLHLSFFSLPFMEKVKKSSVNKKRKSDAHDDDMLMLLPTALSFSNFISMRFGDKCYEHLRSIHALYWEILSNGFSNWKTFVSKDIFQVTPDRSLPSTMEELFDLFNKSLLGKAVAIMQHHLVSSEDTVKLSKRLKLFDSVLPSGTDNLLDCGSFKINHYSIDQSLNLVMKAVTKVQLCKILLFHKRNIQKEEETNGEMGQSSLEVMSNKEHLRSVVFMNTLVSTWRLLVKKVPLNSNSQSESESTKYALFRLLEIFILRILVKVITEMKSNSVINLEQLARSCLLHRFDDPATLGMLQNILTFETEDKSLHVQILQLLLSHSQFAPTIQSAFKSSTSLQFGIIFRPMSSILRSLTFTRMDHNPIVKSELYMKQLELVKLVRVLCGFRAQRGSIGFEQDIGINTKELMFLLLSSYGATLSEKDLEIYKLMIELESTDEANPSYIADMDYLWGPAATRVRKIRETEQAFSSDDMNDTEAIEKGRKSQFRENLPIDPRMCASTVLHFPYHRNISPGHVVEAQTNTESRNIYDPVFILRMSLHGLSMDYIEPVEFASLGLLGVAFVSLSSPDDEIRKLGYKVLAVFRNALEISQKKKESNRLRPLLTYVQNGISEPWQKIPSVHALFAAEASVLLLDPSNDHYKTISKLLMYSPMNTKMVSFFDEFFWSSSANFKSDRIWILRLLFCGQNSEDDCQIYIRSSILEKLISFYSCSLSDNESMELILQIVKKSIKFDKACRYLIERCGVLSWLSCLISNMCGRTLEEQKGVLQSKLAVILEIVNDVVNSRNTSQWLETPSVEQLTQITHYLYVLFTDRFELLKEIHLADLVLEVLSSTLKISQKRDKIQPHLTFSVDGLYRLFQAIDGCCNGEYKGLEVVLMTTPQPAILTMDREKLQEFLFWAVSVALDANESEEFDYSMEKEESDSSLLSKLLHWLTASVILGRLSWQSGDEGSKCDFESSGTLQSFMEAGWLVGGVNRAESESGNEELLAGIIYYLQQILGKKCKVLTSVVCSLCLLLFPDSSQTDGESSLMPLLSRIHCPPEANPSWRWSWEDSLSERCCVDEVEASQGVLVVVSNVLGKKSSLLHFVSNLDVENSGVFTWETSLVVEAE